MPDNDLKERIKKAAEKVRGTNPSDASVNEAKPRMSHEEVMRAFGAVEKKSPNETTTEGSKTPAQPLPKVGANTLPSQTPGIENKLLGNQTLTQAMSPSEKAFQEFSAGKNLQDASKDLLAKNSHLNFIQRATSPEKYPTIKNEDGSFSTHLMAWGEGPNGKPIVFPTIIQQKDGTLKKFDNMDDAYDHAVKNKEYVETPDDKTAAYFSEHGYKQNTFFHKPEDLQLAQKAQAKARLKETPESGKEGNVLVTGYKTMKDFVANQVPKTIASTAAALMPDNPHLLGPDYARGMNYYNQTEEEKKGYKEGATETKKLLINYAGQQDKESQEETGNLTKSLGDVHGFGDLMNYVVHNTANAAAQIPLAVLTGGGSAVMQEVGNHYMEGVNEIAKRKGITPAEVIEKGLDQSAIAIASGALAGGLETLGAKGVAGAINKNALWGTVRDKAYKMLKSAATEGVTEAGQSAVEQTSKGLQAGDSAAEAVKNIDPKQLAEEGVAGAVGALGLHGISSGGKAAIDKVSELTSKKHQVESDLGKENITPASKDILQTEKAAIDSDLEKAKQEVHDEHDKVVNEAIPPTTTPVAEPVEERKEAVPAPEEQPVLEAKNEGKEQKETSEPITNPIEEEKNEPTKTVLSTSEGEQEVSRETNELKTKELEQENTVESEASAKSPAEKEVGKKERATTQRILKGNYSKAFKERATTQRILKGNYSKAFKEGITEEGIHYIPRTHKLSENEAKALIKEKGEDEAMHDLENRENGMLADNRTMLGNLLMDSLETQADKALKEGNQELSDRLNEKANKAEELLSKHLTESGQSISAARSVVSGNRAVMNTRKEIRKKRKEFIKNKQEEIDVKTKAIKEATEEASKEAIKTKRVKEKIDKIRGKQPIEKKPIDAGKEKILKGKSEAKAELSKLFKESASRASSGIDPAIAAKIVKAGSKYIYYSVAEGVHDLKQLRSKLIEEFGKDIEPYADDIINADHEGENLKKLAEDFKVYNVNNNTKKTILDNLEEKLEEVVKKHYTEVDKTKKALSDKIVKELDLPEAQAKEIAKIVEEEFEKLATDKKRKALNKAFNLNAKGLPIIHKKRQHEQLHEQLIKLSNLGALDEEKAAQLYADKFGLPELSAEQASKIKELANAVQRASGKESKGKAAQDLLNYKAKIGGISNGEIAMGIWYANVLSGLSTQETNVLGNITQLIGELTVSVVKNPRPSHVAFELQHLFKGLSRGLLVAKDVLKTGYQPVKDLKIETSNVLENSKWGALHKYVGRVMVAADAIFYHGNKEMWAAHTALMENKGDKNKAIAALFRTPERIKEAEEVAKEEGLTGSAYKRRVAEYIEESREENITEDANNFASKATFNYEPVGVVGSISNGLNNLANDTIKVFSKKGEDGEIKPLKFVIPFTKVIANVFNEQLNWTPWGLVRAAKGGIGLGSPKALKQKFTTEERGRILAKGILGTVGMTFFFLGSADDDDPLFEITANGTGDRAQNFQMQEAGWKPYSIRFRGSKRYFDYRYTPLGLNLALVGFVNDARKYKGEHDTVDKAGIAMMGSVNYIMGSTAVSGMSDFFDSFSKDRPDGGADFFEKWEKIAVRGAKSFIVPNLVTQGIKSYEEVFDMPIKKSHGLLEEAVKDYPIFNDKLDNLYNVLGEPVTPDQLSKFVPFRATVKDKGTEHDKIWNMIIDNHAFISLPKKGQKFYDPKIKEERELTDHEYNEFGRLSGQYIKDLLIKDYDYIQGLPKEARRDKIEKDTEQARKNAKIDLLSK